MLPETSTLQLNSGTLDTDPNLEKIKSLVASTTDSLEKASISSECNSLATTNGLGTSALSKNAGPSITSPSASVNPWKKTSLIQPAKILSEDLGTVDDKNDSGGKNVVESDSMSDRAHVKKKNWVSLETLSPNIMHQSFSTSNVKGTTAEGKEQPQRKHRHSLNQATKSTTQATASGVTRLHPLLKSRMVVP